MGNKQGRSSSPEFWSACRRFSKSELEDLRALFVSLASQSKSNGEFITASVFQETLSFVAIWEDVMLLWSLGSSSSSDPGQ